MSLTKVGYEIQNRLKILALGQVIMVVRVEMRVTMVVVVTTDNAESRIIEHNVMYALDHFDSVEVSSNCIRPTKSRTRMWDITGLSDSIIVPLPLQCLCKG